MKKNVKIKGHIIAWSCYLLLNLLLAIYQRSFVRDNGSGSLFITLFAIVPFIFCFYIGYFIRNKSSLKIFSVIVLVFALFFIVVLIASDTIKFVPVLLPKTISWIAMGGLVNIFEDWLKKRRDIERLHKENTESQLATLRSQVNPHFLFNTLNNIDSLIHQNPNAASESLVKLSGMMRYMFKESNFKVVPLQKELEHLENYIALERLRLKNDNFVQFEITGDAGNKEIAPMLLMPFIENAFKHSVDSTIENGIEISIVIEEASITLHCSNRYGFFDDKDKVSGIGLDNVKKRLALIYPQKHQLNIDDNGEVFEVELSVDLS